MQHFAYVGHGPHRGHFLFRTEGPTATLGVEHPTAATTAPYGGPRTRPPKAPPPAAPRPGCAWKPRHQLEANELRRHIPLRPTENASAPPPLRAGSPDFRQQLPTRFCRLALSAIGQSPSKPLRDGRESTYRSPLKPRPLSTVGPLRARDRAQKFATEKKEESPSSQARARVTGCVTSARLGSIRRTSRPCATEVAHAHARP